MATQITHARSQIDGIVFYSETVPTVGVVSLLTEEGKILAKPQFIGISDFLDNSSVVSLLHNQPDKRIIIAIDAVLILLAILSHNFLAVLAAVNFSVNVSYRLYTLLCLVYCMKFGNMKSLSRFHAAEHKAINAYNLLERVPTFEELKNASMLHLECGSRINIRRIMLQTLISIELWLLPLISGWLYLAAVNLTLLVCYLDIKFPIFLPLQHMLVSEPTDTELKVALEGLNAYDRMEQFFHNITNNKEFDLDE